MKDLHEIDRRLFLGQLCASAATVAMTGYSTKTEAQSHVMHEDRANTHNMLVFGEKKIYLSHLPMFDGLNDDTTEFTAPHRYQVILEASFLRGAQNLQQVYTDDRRKNAGVRIYTLNPENFVLPRLGLGSPQSPLLSGFKAKIFRGHLEKGGQVVSGLGDVNVRVNRIVHFRKFNPHTSQVKELKYLLFGNTQETFLAHYISKPPDFDQMLVIKVSGHNFTDEELGRGLEITIPGKANQASERMKEAQEVTGQIQMPATKILQVNLKADREIYFEEGELLMPPTFEDTKLERMKE